MNLYRFLERIFPSLVVLSISIVGLAVFSMGESMARNDTIAVDVLPASAAASEAPSARFTVVIDAGHGGEDGGTQSADGIYEKDINLSIAQKLNNMLKISGISCVMTRSEDILLYDRQADYHGKKKMLDLKERRRIAEGTENAIFVSIHMNAFPQTRYHGLQVFYSPNNQVSSALAEQVQSAAHDYLQPDNERKIKKSNSSIYLLDRLECPAILVECGFLSNEEEAAALALEEYQQKVSFLLFASLLQFISAQSS